MYSTDSEKAQLLSDHFSTVCSLPPEDASYTLPNFVHKTHLRLNKINITDELVQNVLRTLNVNKANGPDGISNQLLKSCSNSLARPLQHLFNKCQDTGNYPSAWKK